jgi:hypothetical protein
VRKQKKSTIHQPETRHDTVVIAFIHPGQVSAFFNTSVIATLLHDQHNNRRIVGMMQEWSSANVSAARNSLTNRFLDDHEADWLLWIDADMAWEQTAVDALVECADPEKAPIVGGLCFGASQDQLFPTIYQFIKRDDDTISTIRVGQYPTDTMVHCAATGAAFLLIHRSVLEEMRKREFNAAFPFFQETELAGAPAGEDVTFCLRAGICGAPIYVNTAVKIGHHKSHLLTEDLFLSQTEDVDGDELSQRA